MRDDLENRLGKIKPRMLTPIVRTALGSDTLEVSNWDFESMTAVVNRDTNIFRFAGTSRNRGREVSWSVILKVLRRGDQVDDSSHYRYWKREYLLFRSGILDSLPGSLTAPRCLGVSEPSDDECWIWLEEIENEIGPHWLLSHFGPVARHLGQFNGAYLMGESAPADPWLSVNWLRQLVSFSETGIDLLRDSLGHHLVSRWFPPPVARDIFRLWEDREMFLDALDRLPQTFCHRDANWRNLFYQRGPEDTDQTIAVDWQEAGRGAIGEEIVGLTCSSIIFRQVDVTKASDLDRVVFENYLLGLQDVGWRGDSQLVRFGFTAASALHYCFKKLPRLLSAVLDKGRHFRLEEVFSQFSRKRCSIGELMDEKAMHFRYLLDLADEARTLRTVILKV